MVTSKRFSDVDGVTSRFLSDFIIQSEQFARVYNYFYNPAGVAGEIDPGTGLPTRVTDFPDPAEDLVTLDKWDLVDNSILFYTEPLSTSSVYIEVATTPEEFGDTLTAPSVEKAENAAIASEASAVESAASAAEAVVSASEAAQSAIDATDNGAIQVDLAQLQAWDAEAEKLTADSYATEAEDVFVNIVTSDGDGTFTYTPSTDYSSLHWAAKSQLGSGGTLGGLTDVNVPTPLDGQVLTWDSGTSKWISAATIVVTATPILDASTKTQPEGIPYILTVTNWGTYVSPVLTIITEGSTGYVDNLDGTITITPPAFTGVDDIHDIDVQVTDAPNSISNVAVHTLTVQDVQAATGIIIQDATLNDTTIPTTPNATITANELIADADDAVSVTMKYTSGNTNLNLAPTMINTAKNYTISAGATTTSVTITGATTFVTGDILLMNKTATTTLSEIDTTSITTDNGGDSYTFDLTALSFTNAPLTVAKDSAGLRTSLVASAAADGFVVRTAQSHTADGDGSVTPALLDSVNKGTNITLSGGDLIATGGEGSWSQASIYGDTLITEGDIYWEIASSTASNMIGISTINTYQTSYIANVITGFVWYITTLTKYNNGSSTAYASTTAIANDVVGIRYTHSTGELRFYLNGVDQGLAYTLTPATDVYPAMSALDVANVSTFNFSSPVYQPVGTTLLGVDNTATTITDVFDIDTRLGEDIKAEFTQHDTGDGMTSLVINMDEVV